MSRPAHHTLLLTAVALLAAASPSSSADAQVRRPAPRGKPIPGADIPDPDSAPRRAPKKNPAAAQGGATPIAMMAIADDPSALRGRFRVTLTGFTVHQKTIDNVAQLDGKCDEVFVSADLKILDGTGRRIIEGFDPAATTFVFGDVNWQNPNLRKQAGSCSDKGGIGDGDQYPANDPYSGASHPGPRMLPLVLWEGELVKGQNAVVVTPTIWEYDGSQNAAMFEGWIGWARSSSQKLQQSKEFVELIGDKGASGLRLVDLGFDVGQSFISQVLGQDGDRPIGVKRAGQAVSFTPQSLALNYDAVETFLSQGHEVFGLPRGVYPMTYVDTGEWGGGHYTLYVKIERVP